MAVRAKSVNLSVKIAGLHLKTPLIVASGTFGFGLDFERVEGFDYDPIGAMVLKGTTLEPRLGNPRPRIVETAGGAGLINSIGLENPGVRKVVKEFLPRLRGIKTKVIANVAGSTVEEYCEVVRQFDDADRIDAIELNISCPNVKKGGAQFGVDPVMSAEVVAAARRCTSKPLIAKLSPNASDIKAIARACVESGAEALSLINTVSAMAVDARRRRPILGNNVGGLSGPAIKPIALMKLHEVCQFVGGRKPSVPIIGMGGIATALDAMEFIVTGATAFQVGTVLFWNNRCCGEIVDGLRALLSEMGEMDINDVIGTLRVNV
jgi:dihydroorotate dehydrogenase (NAD+) catalytic subunit